MISILSVFWMFVILFGLIGAMRGWAKELLVIFSIVLVFLLWRQIHPEQLLYQPSKMLL